MITALTLVLALAAPPQGQEAKGKPRIPKDSVELVVVGCLSGRVLAIDDVRQTDVQSGPIVRAKSFRVSGKRDLMKTVKEENHRMVEVTGIVKRSSLIEPGVKIGKGITIGGGNPVAGGGRAAPIPQEYIPVIDLESVQPRGISCGGGL